MNGAIWAQLGVIVLGCIGCAHEGAHSARPGALSAPDVLAQVGGTTVGEAQLPEATRAHLAELDDAYLQERFSMVWAGLEDAVGARLLSEAAQAQHQDLNAFLQHEIDAKLGPVSDEEIHGLYEANRGIIDVPFEEAAAELRVQYVRMQREALRRGLIDQLRAEHPVQLSLAPPTLRRRPVDAAGPAIGPADAPLTLVVFSDFTCPYSAQARRLTKRLIELYGPHLRLVHRNLPLARHREARPAAELAVCAAEQARMWPLAELFYENQTRLGDGARQRYAQLAELDMKKLAACLGSGRAKARVDEDVAAAAALGIGGTPAMFLNGMYLRGVLPLPVMCAFVEAEIRRLGMVAPAAADAPPVAPAALQMAPEQAPLEPPHG